MISVICTQCRAQLEMDDAFAGGVCRCQYCGTIQTVPPLSKLKQRQAAPTAAPVPASVTALPAGGVAPRPRDSANGAPVSGLDALAEAVASSSGLGRSSLRSGATQTVDRPAPAAQDTTPLPPVAVEYARPVPAGSRRTTLLIVGLAALAAVLLLLTGGMFFMVRSVATTTSATPVPPPTLPSPQPQDGDGEEIVVPRGPHFCGVSLVGEPTVVYVLDRGQATGELFDTLKEATYRSIESLEPGQKFAVVFWKNGDEDVAYPSDGTLAPASKAEAAAAQQRFKDVFTFGRADPRPAIKRATALKPSALVIVTGRAFDLEDDLDPETRDALVGSQAKVHTFALTSDDGSKVLGEISKTTNGQSKVVTRRELRRYSD
jgi:hypothetical protein